MTITTRARVALFLSIAALLVAGITGAQYVGASSERGAGSEPGSGGGGDGIAGICVEPAAPEGDSAGPSWFEECQDTVDDPVVIDPGDCGEKVSGTGPDETVSYTPCPGDGDPKITEPYDGAQKVEPTPGMSGVSPRIFDEVVVGDDDRTLTVFFWSGVEPCYVLDHVDVDQGPAAITVTLFEGHDSSAGDVACIEIAVRKKVVVQLHEPVGDRRIVDGGA
ncbi:MAG: hypothetical protein M3138_06670 [Actinomycetota bacterium]|nr:hypothetical protein [Actinomycetota bacterium]